MNPTGGILLVNDEPAFLETYRTILATEGYSVDAVTDGPSALAKLEQPRWDLVLLDRKLQGRYGPDTGLDPHPVHPAASSRGQGHPRDGGGRFRLGESR